MAKSRFARPNLRASTILARNAPPAVDDDTRRQPMVGDTGRRLMGFAPDSYSADTHTIEAVLSTGVAVSRCWFVEELEISVDAVDLSRAAANQVKLLDSHNQYEADAVVGTVSNVRIENGQLLGTLTFGQTDRAMQIEGMVARGELTGISIGYQVSTWTMTAIDENDVATWTAQRWALLEVSLVSVPADANAGVRSAGGLTSPGVKQEEDDPMKRNNPGGAPAASATPGAPAVEPTPAAPAAEPARSAEPGAPAPAAQRRHALFSTTSALAFVSNARAFGETVETRANELIGQNERDEISIEAATSALLQAQADAQRSRNGSVSPAGVTATITADERDKMLRGAQNSLIQRAGLTDLFIKAAEVRGETPAEARRSLDAGEFRGVRNAELARMFLERAGARVASWDRETVIGQALTHVDATRAIGNTTSDFANLLENTLHKVLQASYAITPDTWRRFCGTGTLMDFRPHPRYLLGTFGTLDALTEDGSFKHKSIPDAAKESIVGSTKGNIIVISRQALANDDLDAFAVLGVQFGRAAALTIEVDVYACLAQNSGAGPTMNDGNPLFHSSHKNISAVPAAPSVASFDDARVGMASQTDPSGNEVLDISPAVWVGPKSLLGSAQTINDALYDPDTPNKLQKPNMVRGMFADMVGTARLTPTPWFAFADKADAPALEVAFLNGIQDPYLEQRLGWERDGTEYKVRLDYGVGGLNYRSAWKNAGA